MISPGFRAVSICGVLTGSRWNSAIGMTRASPVRRHRLDDRVERAHRDGHIRRMGRDAVRRWRRGSAWMRLNPCSAAQPEPGLALVAGLGRVVEIIAAGPLQQVARRSSPCCAAVPDAPASKRAAQDAVMLAHARVGGKVAVANQRADPQTAVGASPRCGERQPVDVDEVRRLSRPAASSGRADWCRPPMNFAPWRMATDLAAASAVVGSFEGERFHIAVSAHP